MRHFVLLVLLGCLSSGVQAGEGNRLAYLDEFLAPYYVHRDFPKLTTPQWVGQPGVEAVLVLAIDDMREVERYEAYLRPILERLKQIDGRAAVSIMTNRIDPEHPHLQTWLQEGLSLEVHTYDHPCPCLQGGDFAKARQTYERCVDLMAAIDGSRPVAFRMPCCDSRNTPSPRFWAEIFNRVTAEGNFLTIDSSVFHLFTVRDPDLPRQLVLDGDGEGGDREGEREKFRKYIPFPSFVNIIEDYPYPYVIGRLCWQFPCMVPSDWSAQHVQQPNNPDTVRDLKAALDATVLKQGVYNLVFHPHGWIRNDQVVELIDHAVQQHGEKVLFLTFAEAQQRLDQHLLGGQPLRAPNGQDNGVRLLDLNHNGYLDVVIGNSDLRQTRLWSPEQQRWVVSDFPVKLVQRQADGRHGDAGVRFGVLEGRTVMLLRNPEQSGAWRFENGQWTEAPQLLEGLQIAGQQVLTGSQGRDLGVRLRDLDGDGCCELLVGHPDQSAVFQWQAERSRWQPLPFTLPPGTRLVDRQGRDAGLRLVDVDQDGHDDVIFSDEQQYSLHLFDSLETGWATEVLRGRRDQPAGPAIPMIVRHGTNNGAWFHSRHLWVQNEDTDRLPDGVDRLSLDRLLEAQRPLKGEDAPDSTDLGTRATDNLLALAGAGDPCCEAGDEGDEAAEPAPAYAPRPRSPAESLAAFRPRPGMQVELVAAEPLVADPVAFDWGPDGRLWVVEMRDYPLGLDGQGQPGGRVKVLEDTTGDGRYDQATLFLDELPFPTGIKVWRQGVLVTAAPDIFYAEDTTGDGRADVRKTLYRGFGQGNQQHRVNGLRWGLDNWLYVANGDSGGAIESVETGQRIDIRGRDLRIRPDQGLLEAQSGQTQFGRDRDDWGNWFGGNNSNPMWHYVLADHYLSRNPHVAPPAVRKPVSVQPGTARVFPVSRTLERFNDPAMANRFTSACSPIIYRDRLLGPQFAGNAFVCEPVHNLVHREVVAAEGVSFTSRRAEDEQQSEFLASEDNWFRPAMARTGPDGALWVADMYRLVIEHPEWIPAEWQQRLDLRAGDNRGRIYRVYPENGRPRQLPRLDRLDTAGLVEALDSPNGWQRDMAQQMLVWGADGAAVEPLQRLAATAGRPLARLHALCTLEGLDRLPLEAVLRALGDEHPGVRRHAVRMAERHLEEQHPQLGPALLELLEDDDPQVQLQLAYTLGQWDDDRAGRALAELALSGAENEYLAAAVFSSVHQQNIGPLLAGVLGAGPGTPARQKLVETLLGLAAALGDQTVLDRAVAAIGQGDERRGAAWQFTALAGMLQALQRRDQPPARLLGEAGVGTLEGLFARARHTAADGQAEPAERLAAVRLLGQGLAAVPAADRQLLGGLLVPQNSPQLQSAAVAALGQVPEQQAAELLLDGWNGYTPSLRSEVLDSLLGRPAWTARLLQALESGQVLAGHLDARRRQQLAQHQDPAVARRAEKLLAAASSPDRARVVEDYRKVRELAADAARGQQVFQRQCAACHRLDGTGHAVGPDLAALNDKSLPTLLAAILDPNQAIEDRYLDYAAVTDQGRQFSGILASETGTSITLVGPNGQQVVLLRNQLEMLRSTGKSLMPEGMERDLPPQDLADLIAYLQQDRSQ